MISWAQRHNRIIVLSSVLDLALLCGLSIIVRFGDNSEGVIACAAVGSLVPMLYVFWRLYRTLPNRRLPSNYKLPSMNQSKVKGRLRAWQLSLIITLFLSLIALWIVMGFPAFAAGYPETHHGKWFLNEHGVLHPVSKATYDAASRGRIDLFLLVGEVASLASLALGFIDANGAATLSGESRAEPLVS